MFDTYTDDAYQSRLHTVQTDVYIAVPGRITCESISIKNSGENIQTVINLRFTE